MKFPIRSIEEAVATHVSAALAPRLRDAAAVALGGPLAGDPELSLADIGQALAVALCAAEPKHAAQAVEALALSSVHLQGSLGVVALQPDDALEHALFASWLRSGFGDLVGVVIRAGATMANLAPGWPLFDRCALVESDGVVVNATARVSFRDPEAVADLVFGGPADTNRLLVHKVIGGDGLFGVGMDLRESLTATPPLNAPAVEQARGALH